MSRSRTVLAVLAAGLLVSALPAEASSPAAVGSATGISVTGNGGFKLVEQRELGDGRVVATFKSLDGTVSTIGRPGMVVDIQVDSPPVVKGEAPHGSVSMTITSPAIDKSVLGADESRGASAVESLIALGVDPAVAKRDFGSFDSPTGATAPNVTLASMKVPAAPSQPTPAVSSTVPWETQCANLSYVSGKITGRGCSTIYLTAANGTDWWFETKYQVTATSSDTSLFPVRVKGLGWKLTWNDSHNNVYLWEPHTTIYGTSGCNNVTLSAIVITETWGLCPTKEIPWDVAATRSGALWSGVEHDNDPVGVGGVQADENPPAATTTSHFSTYSLSW